MHLKKLVLSKPVHPSPVCENWQQHAIAVRYLAATYFEERLRRLGDAHLITDDSTASISVSQELQRLMERRWKLW